MVNAVDAADASSPTGADSVKFSETWGSDAGFYLIMALVAALLLLAGFAPSFYLKSVIHAPPPLSRLTMTHGVVFTAWMGIFVVQAALIRLRRPAVHRQLGILGVILFGAMVSLALSTALTAGRLGHVPPGSPPPLAFMALPIFALVGLMATFGLAVWNRRRSDWHKRLMVASFFMMTPPGTHRLTVGAGFPQHGTSVSLAVAELLLAICAAYDLKTHGRVHPAYLVSAAVMAAVHVGVMWAYHSPAWLKFATVLASS